MITNGIAAGSGYVYAFIPAILFLILALAEVVRPRRALVLGRLIRWRTHGIFFLCNAALGRAFAHLTTAGGTAVWAQKNGLGLFNGPSWHAAVPIWITVLMVFILLDFAIWLQHRLMHRVPFLWHMHKVHHSDRDLDVSSALRFHPFEIAVSVLYKSVWIIALGAPVAVVLAFELWLNGNALFNHSNIRLPRKVDRLLRTVFVTPDIHFIHHSAACAQQHRNFGFALNIWDRMAGCYRAGSSAERGAQIVGLEEAQDIKPRSAIWSLLQPFKP